MGRIHGTPPKMFILTAEPTPGINGTHTECPIYVRGVTFKERLGKLQIKS